MAYGGDLQQCGAESVEPEEAKDEVEKSPPVHARNARLGIVGRQRRDVGHGIHAATELGDAP